MYFQEHRDGAWCFKNTQVAEFFQEQVDGHGISRATDEDDVSATTDAGGISSTADEDRICRRKMQQTSKQANSNNNNNDNGVREENKTAAMSSKQQQQQQHEQNKSVEKAFCFQCASTPSSSERFEKIKIKHLHT